MSRSVGAWNGSFDSGKRRAEARSASSLVHPAGSYLLLQCYYRVDNKSTVPSGARQDRNAEQGPACAGRGPTSERHYWSRPWSSSGPRASTARRRVRSHREGEAHQPQINYHFESKAALWTAAVDYLFGLFGTALDGVSLRASRGRNAGDRAGFADGIRRFVRFAAEHPELNQIMVHEGTAPATGWPG